MGANAREKMRKDWTKYKFNPNLAVYKPKH